ncbi:MAG: hypothetical protein B6230_04915 [Desulfobacteraceae bacterium 4572_89]|nr:MAG: hypothetical protein B6230_04915 [Desulfobacteraceae bacterium 4572_89]
MELKTITIENPNELNFILGHSHFIKTVEDIYEAVVCTVPDAKFGVAFCEASMECLVRYSGTDEEMIELAKKNAFELSVIIAQTEQGRGILGIIDGFSSKGIETTEDIEKRKGFLRMIGYKQ